MKRCLGTIAAVTTLVAAALLGGGAGVAGAAPVEFGSDCAADDGTTPSFMLVQAARPGSAPGLPVGGVVTKWTVNSAEKATFGQKLKIVRAAPANQFTIVAESATASVATGTHSFEARIPVSAGDLIGLAGAPETGALECSPGAAGEMLRLLEGGNFAVGQTVPASGTYAGAVPVKVSIEPDSDKDGYGDETQDSCPEAAAVHQGACPSVTPTTGPSPGGSPPAAAKPHPLALAVTHKGSATVKVTTDVGGPVTVTGHVALGGGANATLRGGTKTLTAGQRTAFALKFPKALKEKLGELPAKQKLKLKVVVKAAGAAGLTGFQRLTVKLPGQG